MHIKTGLPIGKQQPQQAGGSGLKSERLAMPSLVQQQQQQQQQQLHLQQQQQMHQRNQAAATAAAILQATKRNVITIDD